VRRFEQFGDGPADARLDDSAQGILKCNPETKPIADNFLVREPNKKKKGWLVHSLYQVADFFDTCIKYI